MVQRREKKTSSYNLAKPRTPAGLVVLFHTMTYLAFTISSRSEKQKYLYTSADPSSSALRSYRKFIDCTSHTSSNTIWQRILLPLTLTEKDTDSESHQIDSERRKLRITRLILLSLKHEQSYFCRTDEVVGFFVTSGSVLWTSGQCSKDVRNSCTHARSKPEELISLVRSTAGRKTDTKTQFGHAFKTEPRGGTRSGRPMVKLFNIAVVSIPQFWCDR